VVDNTADVVTENAGEGKDLVQSAVTYTLGDPNVENLTLTGTTAINGTGNALDNVLTGNSAVNTLTGGAGNDTLDGGTGADSLVGGTGNDVYIVDNASDKVIENANEGIDLVQSGVTWTLATSTNIENLTLTSTSAINGTGNTLDNVLIGNSAVNALTGGAGNDTLDGGVGADSLAGGTGNDTYIVDNASDKVVENAGEGTDTVKSSVTWSLASLANVENLTLTGTSAINATGNATANVLVGNGVANTLTGGGGNDTYQGGQGADALSATSTTSNDVYIWGRGEGADTLTDAGGTDQLQVLAGVTSDQVWLRHVSNNLEASVIGTTDTFTITNWYTSAANQVESLKLADGKMLTAVNAQKLVDAMASFSPPAQGQTTLPANYQSALSTVIAANWT
jgi:Ca2+-binding RTX toxin-like protein